MFGAPAAQDSASEPPLPLPPPPAPRPVSRTPAPITPIVIDGLSAPAVRALLGTPVTQSATGPGETWTYRSGRCELAVFLFPDVESGGLRVLDHEVTGVGAREVDQQNCMRQVQRDHAS